MNAARYRGRRSILFGGILLVVGSTTCPAQIPTAARTGKLSPRLSAALVASFAQHAPAENTVESAPLPLESPVDAPPDADVYVLPEFSVTEKRSPLTGKSVVRVSEAVPGPLGTDVKEFRGGKILVRRILYIPVAVKLRF